MSPRSLSRLAATYPTAEIFCEISGMRSPSASSRHPLSARDPGTMKPPPPPGTGSSIKFLLLLSVLVIVALVAATVSQSARHTAELLECVGRYTEVEEERDALKRKQEDGSLLAGLTASSFKVHVAKGNEDVLRMTPTALVKQIQQLREIVAQYNSANKRLVSEKRRLAQEKEQAVDRLARQAVTSSADSDAGHVECGAKLRAMALEATSLKDDLETSRTEHMTTKSRLDEARDQLKSADVALAGATEAMIGLKSKLEQARMKLSKCGVGGLLQAPFGQGSTPRRLEETSQQEHDKCGASGADMKRYLDYGPRKPCPNDWLFVQRLIFKQNCFALPRRLCRARTPSAPVQPLPLPESLFDQKALDDRNVRWDMHLCKSFECLNARETGACRGCFNMSQEERRWKATINGAIPMADVVEMKKGGLRLGLDVGGGTGSFAAHMARFGVTVMTTAMNVETAQGKNGGLPYMETIAVRGLIPLHLPHTARLPLFDGVLDIVHSVSSTKYAPPAELEELLYEWDRILRVGGIFWFEMFQASVEDMPKYVTVLEGMGYKKLYWNFTAKAEKGEGGDKMVFLNCVLEKKPVTGTQEQHGLSAHESIGLA